MIVSTKGGYYEADFGEKPRISKADICGDLEKHAYSVNDGIRDNGIRNANILSAV